MMNLITYLRGCPSVQNDKKKYFVFICYSIILINVVCFSISINISCEFNLEMP